MVTRRHSANIPPWSTAFNRFLRDYQEKTEFAFARMMYPPGWNDGYRGRFDGDWRQGLSLWTQDYPPADRAFSQAVRRLTRIHTRSVEAVRES